jgi:hypothetical protein
MSTASKETRVKTTYHVFAENDGADGKRYSPIAANVEAANSQDAIRKTVKTSGSYVAIPARSFVVVKVKIEQVSVVKLT